jgi:hypothetical protein
MNVLEQYPTFTPNKMELSNNTEYLGHIMKPLEYAPTIVQTDIHGTMKLNQTNVNKIVLEQENEKMQIDIHFQI